jgi:hypothetical protein
MVPSDTGVMPQKIHHQFHLEGCRNTLGNPAPLTSSNTSVELHALEKNRHYFWLRPSGRAARNGERLGEAARFPGRRSLRTVERLGLSRSSRVRSAGTRSTRSGRF